MTSCLKKNGGLCAQYVYFDEHQCPVLWRVTDRHITLSERETNGILPHLTAAAAAASTIISSLIMSNKATHRQAASFFFALPPTLRTFPRSRSLDAHGFLKKCLKNRVRHAHLACDFVLGDGGKKHRGLESSSSRRKQNEERSAPFAPRLWSLGKCNSADMARRCAG